MTRTKMTTTTVTNDARRVVACCLIWTDGDFRSIPEGARGTARPLGGDRWSVAWDEHLSCDVDGSDIEDDDDDR